MAVDFCFERLGFTSFEQVDRMTVAEFSKLIEAHRRKDVRKTADLHRLAWLIREIKATKRGGKRYVYDKFEKFYDVNKALGLKSDTDKQMDSLLEYKRKKLKEERSDES